MKLIIDIPEKLACEGFERPFTDEEVNILLRAIGNGTPLPKGHGDLKDTEELKKAFVAWSMAVHGNFTDADIASIIYNSPTIIKADKDKEEEK